MGRWGVRIVVLVVVLSVGVGAAIFLTSRDDEPASSENAVAEEPKKPKPQRRRFELLGEVKADYKPGPHPDDLESCYKEALEGLGQLSYERMQTLQAGHPLSGPTKDLGFIAAGVEMLRHLSFERTPPIEFLSEKGVSRTYISQLDEEYSEAQFLDREDILKMLGAINPYFDLRTATTTYEGSDILGFYDPRKAEIFTPSSGSTAELSEKQKEVLSHELMHALVDQVLPDPFAGYRKTAYRDEGLAVTAVQEGDASFVEQLFRAAGLRKGPLLYKAVEPKPGQNWFTSRESMFPYLDGLGFVCDIFLARGWEGLDQLYSRPPTSSAEILWPQRYLKGYRPRNPRDVTDPGKDWEQDASASLGALDLFSLFQAPGAKQVDAIAPVAKIGAVVEEWDGGELALFRDEFDENALGISLRTRSRNSSLCHAMGKWMLETFDAKPIGRQGYEMFAAKGLDHFGIVWCKADEIRAGVAPTMQTARALVARPAE